MNITPHLSFRILTRIQNMSLPLSLLALMSCSVPEDKLWEKRISNISVLQGETTYVAALDLDLEAFVDTIDPKLLAHRAERDFAIFAHNTPAAILADSEAFVEDSILPKLVMDDVQELLRNHIALQPLAQELRNWTLDPVALRTTLQRKAQAAIGISNSVDSLMGIALGPDEAGVTKVPVAAILLRQGRTYWWTMLTCWSTPEDHMGFAHYDATIYRVKDGKELGRFYGSWGSFKTNSESLSGNP